MKRGFTLMEILLALLVVSIGIVSVIGLLSSTLDTTLKARDDLHTVSFADMVLNHFQAVGDWSSLPTAGTVKLRDYNETDITLAIGSTEQFTVLSEGKDDTSRERFTITYKLDIEQNGNTKTVTLQIWPGFTEEGSPKIFQTEIYNWNKMP